MHNKTRFNNVTFYIRDNNNVINILSYVKFKKGGTLWINDNNGLIKIHEASTFENVHLAVTEPNTSIHIGNDCMFAYDIEVRTGDSHSIIDTATNKRINSGNDVFIGTHVCVASHASILKGVRIPNNSTVATRAVVTKTFDEENILLGGLPAKILKRKIDWDRVRL